jgi:hypothetical protein
VCCAGCLNKAGESAPFPCLAEAPLGSEGNGLPVPVDAPGERVRRTGPLDRQQLAWRLGVPLQGGLWQRLFDALLDVLLVF